MKSSAQRMPLPAQRMPPPQRLPPPYRMPPAQRLPWLDWVRGAAALVMLQGHVFDSFLRKDLKSGGPFMFSQFVGGMPPAVFLFLLGMTFAFLMDSLERKGVPARRRVLGALRRAGYLLACAFAFRFQMWVVAFDQKPWTDMLRVDVLNNMAMAVAVFSVMAVFTTVERIRLCAILGAAIAFASPLVSGVNWSGTPEIVRNYIIPDHAFFGFFPWASYVAFGMSFGSILRREKPTEEPMMMQWTAWVGLAMCFAGLFFAGTPLSVYSNSDFWLNSPALVFIKTGIVLMVIPFAWLWNSGSALARWSWVRQFGMTSLLVYWVHIELVYGRELGVLKETLTLAQTIAMAIGVILLMLALSLARTNWAVVRSYVWPETPAAADKLSGGL
jgi:uncharacterized membrane protein